MAGSSWTGRFSLALLALVIFGIAFAHYRSEVGTTNFHPDESRWINRAHYLEDLLDPFGPTWNDQYLTRGQPPIGSYVMGVGLAVQGVDSDTNYAWDFRRARDWNIQNGMFPTPEELRAGRMTNVFLGAVSVVITFFAVRMLTNTIGGIVGATILTFHPLLSWHNRLALADTTLILTLAATVLMTILLLRRPGWFRALAVGILIGTGGANKLTPLSLAFVLAGVGLLMLIGAYRHNRNEPLRGESWLSAVPRAGHVSWMLLSTPFVAGATFVATYPYLWPSPIARTLLLIDFRQIEMVEQARLYPRFAVGNPFEAVLRTWEYLALENSATGWALTRLGLPGVSPWLAPLDLILAIGGIVALLLVASRLPIRTGHLVVSLVLLAQVGTIILSMRTDFERYYLPIVLAIAIFAGSGAGIATRMLAGAALLGRHRARAHQPTPYSGSAPRTEVTGS